MTALLGLGVDLCDSHPALFHADDVIGEYRLLRPLGEGALGVVWHAQRVDRPDTVALKLLNPDRVPQAARAKAYEGLTRALTKTGRLEHINLQTVVGTALRPEDGVFAIASRHYEGGPFENLGNVGKRGTLIKALGLLRQVAEVLDWLHELGLVHGNVKPTNTLISPGPDGPRAVLMDLCWSTAHLARRTERTRVFVSPEQLAKRPATAASDQWATARMLHQLVVQASPGKGQTEALTSLPLPVLRVMQRALAPDPKARFANMSNFVMALEHAEDELGGSGSSGPVALPTPTLEVSAVDAEIVIAEAPTAQTPRVIRQAEPEPEPEAAEDPTPAMAMPPEAPTEPGTMRKVTPQAPSTLNPSSEIADPTTPMSLRSINPSGEREEHRPPPRAVLPSDPTDILPAIKPNRPGPNIGAIAMITLSLVAIAGGAFVLFNNTAPREAPVAVAQDEPEKDATKPAPKEAPVPAKSNAPAVANPDATAKPVAVANPVPPKPTKAETPVAVSPNNGGPLGALTKACESNSRTACKKLGDAYLRGRGVPKDIAQGRALYAKSCQLRLISACTRAGALFAATGRNTDARKARRYYERACDAGRAPACGALSKLWASGKGGTANARTAGAFANRACKMGHQPSCP